MSDYYLGEIRLFANRVVPADWQRCDGQLLQVAQYKDLFSIIGNTYGGDGVKTFALPDLRGRVPIHFSADFPLGKSGGEVEHTLALSEMPKHEHAVYGSSDSVSSDSPEGTVWGTSSAANLYSSATANTQLHKEALSSVGQGAAHSNMQPYLAVNFYIAVNGILPPRNG